MRAIRSLLPLVVIALFLVACSGSASAPNLAPVGGPVTDEGSGTGSGSVPGAMPAASAAAAAPQPVQGGDSGPIAASMTPGSSGPVRWDST